MPVRPHRRPLFLFGARPSGRQNELKLALQTAILFFMPFLVLLACSKSSPPAPASTPTTSTATAAAVPPAPAATPRVRTELDFDRERLAWLRRHSIPPAQKASGQDLPLDPNLAQFLERACLFQSRQEGAPAADALEAEGRGLYETGYDNPVFLRAYGQVLAACGKTTESSDVETQALMKFPEPVASPINMFMASAQLAAAMRAAHGPFYPAALAVQRAALRKLHAAIAEGAFTTAESPIALALLADNVAAAGLPSPWRDALAGLQNAKIDPGLAQMIRGMAALEAEKVAGSQLPVASNTTMDNQLTTGNRQLATGNSQTTTGNSDTVPAVPLLGLKNVTGTSTWSQSMPSMPSISSIPVSTTTAAADSPLIAALTLGDAAAANQLIRDGAPIAVADREGLTPLHLATARRLTETMRLLLGRGAAVNATSPLGETPLHLACKSGAIESVRLLLDAGANPNAPSPEGWTPLDLAVQRQYASIAGLLLERGASVNAAGRGTAPLMVAVQAGSAEIARKLLDLGADPNATPYPPATPLHEAIRLGHAPIAIDLIDLGAKVNVPDRRNRTPLHAAVERRLPTVAAKLIATGALPDARNAEGATALELAIEQGDAEMVRTLLENRVGTRIPTSSGGTHLDLARQKGNAQIVELIEGRIK